MFRCAIGKMRGWLVFVFSQLRGIKCRQSWRDVPSVIAAGVGGNPGWYPYPVQGTAITTFGGTTCCYRCGHHWKQTTLHAIALMDNRRRRGWTEQHKTRIYTQITPEIKCKHCNFESLPESQCQPFKEHVTTIPGDFTRLSRLCHINKWIVRGGAFSPHVILSLEYLNWKWRPLVEYQQVITECVLFSY